MFVFLILLITVSTGNVYAHHHYDSLKMSGSDSLMQQEMAEHQQMEAVNAFPNYHPLVVHFPIVLLLMAAVFQLLSFFFYKKEFSVVTLILLALGVISTWLSSNTFHADTGVLAGKAKEIFQTHEQMATLTWWFSLFALIIKIPSHFFFKRKWWLETAASLLLIASAVTVSIAGHHGAMLVHMEGIGPMGKYLDSYALPKQNDNSTSGRRQNESEENFSGGQEDDHHVGERGKGPHGGTLEEADPYHMEIVANGNDLIFYLLDGDAKPLDLRDVTGSVKIQYTNKLQNTINLMMMKGKLTAIQAQDEQAFIAVCTLIKENKSYSATFNSAIDLPGKKSH